MSRRELTLYIGETKRQHIQQQPLINTVHIWNLELVSRTLVMFLIASISSMFMYAIRTSNVDHLRLIPPTGRPHVSYHKKPGARDESSEKETRNENTLQLLDRDGYVSYLFYNHFAQD